MLKGILRDGGSSGGGVTSLNNETGDVLLTSTGGTVTITPNGQAINLEAGGSAYYAWSEITGNTQASINNAYIANNASQIVITLPTTAMQGQRVQVVNKGAGGWKIAQNSGQTTHFATASTTTGITGSLQSQANFDSIEIVNITANTDWLVFTSVGNILVT